MQESDVPGASTSHRRYWSRICQALRPLLKDAWHYATNAAMGEGEAFAKFAEVRFEAVIAGKKVRIRVVIRSYEAAISDGFIIASFDTVKDAPADDASYQEWWSWARQQKEVLFIPFDVKVLSLDQGRPGHYYQFSETSISSSEQSDHTKLIIALIEGMHNHMAFVPTGAWTASRDLSYGLDTIAQRAPLWLRMYLVSDEKLESAIISLVRHCLDEEGWFTNPFTAAAYDGWRAEATDTPKLNPGAWRGLDSSFEAVLMLWKAVESCEGKVFFNPYTPLFADFMLVLPGVEEPIWSEHKAQNVTVEGFVFDLDPRRNVFEKYRTWQLLYAQCRDGILAIMRNDVKKSWFNCANPPPDMLKAHRFNDFASALDYIKDNADKARERLAEDIGSLEPQDINVGLPTDLSSRSINNLPSRQDNDDPLGELLLRRRLPTDVPEVLLKWCRRSKKGVLLGLDSGDGFGSHTLVEHDWQAADELNYDQYGILPFNLTDRYSADVSNRRCILLQCQDLSAADGGITIGLPIAQKKDFWKMVLKSPRFFIIGRLLERLAWCLLLPSGFTHLYTSGKHIEEIDDKVQASAPGDVGTHVVREIGADDNVLPGWATLSVTSRPFNDQFLIDKKIDLGRYVLDNEDGTIFRQLYRLFDESDNEISIENPLLRRSRSRLFPRSEYIVQVSSLMDSSWRYGLERYKIPHRDPGDKKRGQEGEGTTSDLEVLGSDEVET